MCKGALLPVVLCLTEVVRAKKSPQSGGLFNESSHSVTKAEIFVQSALVAGLLGGVVTWRLNARKIGIIVEQCRMAQAITGCLYADKRIRRVAAGMGMLPLLELAQGAAAIGWGGRRSRPCRGRACRADGA